MDRTVAPRLFSLAVLVVALAAAVALLTLRTLSLVATLPSPRFEVYVELPLLVGGALVAAWVTITVLCAAWCVTAEAVGLRWHAGERWVARRAPVLVRRVAKIGVTASVGAGLVLGAGAGAAQASEPQVPDDVARSSSTQVLDLGWQPTGLDGTAGGQAVSPAAPEPDTASLSAATPVSTPMHKNGEVVVLRGDTLWAIAKRSLAPGASDGQILAEVSRWHATNHAVIGDDPNLILPGQVLASPAMS